MKKLNIQKFAISSDLSNSPPVLNLTKPNPNDKYDISIQNSNMDKIDTILDLVYPIGRGFIDFTDMDYSNYLGFTWERELVGLTPVGLDSSQTEFNTIGKIGGEKTHKLTINEMPKHKHGLRVTLDLNTGAGNERCPISGGGAVWSTHDYYPMENTGEDQSHNNLQPYKVVAYWKRIK